MYAFEACSGCESVDAEYENGSPRINKGISYEEETVDRIFISQVLERLSPKERQVITMRYMLDQTQSSIAKKLGISQVQVSRIEKKAILSMRSMTESAVR